MKELVVLGNFGALLSLRVGPGRSNPIQPYDMRVCKFNNGAIVQRHLYTYGACLGGGAPPAQAGIYSLQRRRAGVGDNR